MGLPIEVFDGELGFRGDAAQAGALSVALGRSGIGIRSLVPHTATLEELFLDMTEQESAA